MDGDRATRLVPVVVAVILGLLGMHALVVADTGHSMPSAARSVVSATGTLPPAGDHAAAMPSQMASQAPSQVPSTAATPVVEAPGAATAAAPLAPHGRHSSTHQLLHLCLAVLAALLVVLAGLLLAVTATVPDGPGGSAPGRGRRAPPRRPPPTSVRLARLCVMRN